MKKIRKEMHPVEIVSSIVCDVCGKVYNDHDWEEMQEFHSISFRAGYGSVFGDGNLVECDICQHCLKNLLSKYMRINDEA